MFVRFSRSVRCLGAFALRSSSIRPGFGDNQALLVTHDAQKFEVYELDAKALGEATLDIHYARAR